jgi:protein CpxP
MKIAKLGSVLVASLFVLNSFGQAEGRPEKRELPKHEMSEKQKQTPEQKAQMQTDRLSKQLLLTEDQKAKIYETNLAVNMKNEAVQTHSTWTKEQKSQAFEGNNSGRYTVIKSYLTNEQLTKFEQMEVKSSEPMEVKANDSEIKREDRKLQKKN